MEAEFAGATINESLTPAPGVRVLAEGHSQLALVVPAPPSVAITVRWQQSSDPSSDPDDPATACVASRVVTLPVRAARRSRALKLRQFKLGWDQGNAAFAVVPALKDPDLSPLEVSIRTTSRARLPKAHVKARRMAVPMRTVDKVDYPKELPSLFHLSTARRCRFYLLTCGAVFSEVDRPDLDTDALQHGVVKADINGLGGAARPQPAGPHGGPLRRGRQRQAGSRRASASRARSATTSRCASPAASSPGCARPAAASRSGARRASSCRAGWPSPHRAALTGTPLRSWGARDRTRS